MANYLATILEKFGIKSGDISAFFKKETSVIGVDIGSSFIKVVQLKKKGGRAVLETYGELALGPLAGLEVGRMTNLTEDKLSQALIDIIKESNVTATQAGFSIPLAASLISFVEIPYTTEKQLSETIPLEARKYIPVPINEVTLDWWIIPKEEDAEAHGETIDIDSPEAGEGEETKATRKADVLIAAIHNGTLDRYGEIIKRAKLQSSFFEIEVFSTIRSTFTHEVAPVMIFDMGAGMTKLSIVERGVMRIVHIVNRGSQEITLNTSSSLGISVARAEELKREYGLLDSSEDGKAIAEIAKTNMDYVFSEANRVLLNYERKHGKTVGKVVLTGGGVLLRGFLDEAVRNLEAEVVLGDPFSKVEAPAFLVDVLKEAGPEFAVAIGVALRKLQELD